MYDSSLFFFSSRACTFDSPFWPFSRRHFGSFQDICYGPRSTFLHCSFPLPCLLNPCLTVVKTLQVSGNSFAVRFNARARPLAFSLRWLRRLAPRRYTPGNRRLGLRWTTKTSRLELLQSGILRLHAGYAGDSQFTPPLMEYQTPEECGQLLLPSHCVSARWVGRRWLHLGSLIPGLHIILALLI